MSMLVMDILMAAASFETRRRRERQMEGIAVAKLQGKYKGRKQKTQPGEVKALRDRGMGASAIARTLGCSRRNGHRLHARWVARHNGLRGRQQDSRSWCHGLSEQP